MELKIYNPAEDGFIKKIDWNHEEIKKEVSEKVEYYKNLVYTDDQIKEAKADRATLNKFVTALENKRKEIKKQCLAPYEAFEKQMKEITSVVQEPIALIDAQVKGYDEKKKQEKLDEITSYFNSTEHPEWLHIAQIMNDKWMNASVSMKSVTNEINARLEQIKNDLSNIANLPEFSFEATETYKFTLDLGKAINEAHRLSEMAKKKAEAERLKAESEAEQAGLAAEAQEQKKETVVKAEAEEVNADIQEVPLAEVPEDVLPKQWVSFKALLTVEQAMELKKFFEDRHIEFKAI